jgi:hypothetical protein
MGRRKYHRLRHSPKFRVLSTGIGRSRPSTLPIGGITFYRGSGHASALKDAAIGRIAQKPMASRRRRSCSAGASRTVAP